MRSQMPPSHYSARKERRNTNVRKSKYISSAKRDESAHGRTPTSLREQSMTQPEEPLSVQGPQSVTADDLKDNAQLAPSTPPQCIAESSSVPPTDTSSQQAPEPSFTSPPTQPLIAPKAIAEIDDYSARTPEPESVFSTTASTNTLEPTPALLPSQDIKEAPTQLLPATPSSSQVAASSKISRGNRKARNENLRARSSVPPLRVAKDVLPNGLPNRSQMQRQPVSSTYDSGAFPL